IPVVVLEADLTPGLASKITAVFATKVLYSFEESARFLPASKSVYTGLPINKQILQGSPETGLTLCHFSHAKTELPVLCVMGGSTGSLAIESLLARDLAKILLGFRIIFLGGTARLACNDGPLNRALKTLPTALTHQRIKIFPYVTSEMPHLYAASDFALSRAGAHSIFELLMMKIPVLYIPLEQGSRGDQLDNARIFEQKGISLVAREQELAVQDSLWQKISELKQKSSTLNLSAPKMRQNQLAASDNVITAISDYL
ncbi:MAG: glycosyltransferase, partial [Proteobacteria bacterium]|nr:glycosyltransferase [Pseudomonadota bacterium]